VDWAGTALEVVRLPGNKLLKKRHILSFICLSIYSSVDYSLNVTQAIKARELDTESTFDLPLQQVNCAVFSFLLSLLEQLLLQF